MFQIPNISFKNNDLLPISVNKKSTTKYPDIISYICTTSYSLTSIISGSCHTTYLKAAEMISHFGLTEKTAPLPMTHQDTKQKIIFSNSPTSPKAPALEPIHTNTNNRSEHKFEPIISTYKPPKAQLSSSQPPVIRSFGTF